MIKLLTTVLLALLLTACGSDNDVEAKKFETEKKAEVVTASENNKTELTKTPTVESKASTKKVAEPTPTYVKNIFELVTIEGKTLHVDEVENGVIFQEHKDKVVFLLFFGYRCPPCLSEIPALKKIAQEKGEKLEIIAMEVQRLPEDQLKIFKEKKKLNYTILSGEHGNNGNFISYIAERAQWTGAIPFLVGIAPNGEVGFVHLGGMSYSQFSNIFNQLSK